MQAALGLELTHVPYKGAGPAVIAALGGEINLALVGAPPALPHIKSGKLLPLAVTQPARSSLLPDVPTMAQAAAVMADADLVTWYGLMAPARTPAPTANAGAGHARMAGHARGQGAHEPARHQRGGRPERAVRRAAAQRSEELRGDREAASDQGGLRGG